MRIYNTMTATEYVRRKDAISYTPFLIDKTGRGYYWVDGVKVREKDWKLINFIPEKVVIGKYY